MTENINRELLAQIKQDLQVAQNRLDDAKFMLSRMEKKPVDPSEMVPRLRILGTGISGQFFDGVADRIEDLESENENLHIENDALCKRVQNEQPGNCSACKKTSEDGQRPRR